MSGISKDRSSTPDTRRSRLFLYGAIGLLVLFALSIVPVFILGRYDFPSMDDFCYGIRTREAVLSHGYFLGAVWTTVSGYYMHWQGSFSALALMAVTPCIFGIKAYFLTPIVMIASLCCGTYKLMDTIVRRWLGGSWIHVVYLAVAMLLLSIQFVPSPVSAFYWWNGAVYYTFTYGIMLFYIERLIALCLAKTRGQVLWAVLPAIPAGILVGGSNYVSALLCLLISGFFFGALLYKKRRAMCAGCCMMAPFIVSVLISVLSPGNGTRQALEAKMAPLNAVGASIEQAWRDLLAYPSWMSLLTFLLLLPMIASLVKKVTFRFPYPVIFSMCSFLLFAAQNTPHFYAASWAGPERLRSIVYYSFYWLVLLNEGYWLGWLHKKRQFFLSVRVRRGGMTLLLCMLAFCFFRWYLPGTACSQCAVELTDGSAYRYAQEWEARLVVLEDPAFQNVRLQPLETKPYCLYNGDISSDPEHWSNHVMAVYFGKKSVALKMD